MDFTNMRRVQFGLEGWVDPSDFSAMQEEQDKAVLGRVEPRMVKLTGFDSHGNTVQHASGFLYTKDADVIVTCNHVRSYLDSHRQRLDVSSFKAQYADGTEEAVNILTPATSDPALMLLGGKRRADTDMVATSTVRGDTAYVGGFPPGSTLASFSKGIIGAVTVSSLTVDAHADNGWSGGPVLNRRGLLVGIIKGGLGTTIWRPEAVPASGLHYFAIAHNAPGLKA